MKNVGIKNLTVGIVSAAVLSGIAFFTHGCANIGTVNEKGTVVNERKAGKSLSELLQEMIDKKKEEARKYVNGEA